MRIFCVICVVLASCSKEEPIEASNNSSVISQQVSSQPKRANQDVTAIIMHSSAGVPFDELIHKFKETGYFSHVVVRNDGRIFFYRPLGTKANCATALDDVAVHIMVEGGIGKELIDNSRQFEAVSALVSDISRLYGIQKTNYDVGSACGIFSHTQVKYRFGGFRLGELKNRMEPGEEFMEALLRKIGGKYFPEKEWKERFTDDWCQVLETPEALKQRKKLEKGRGLTPKPKAELKSVEQDSDGFVIEEKRLKYADRGKIEKISGIVLHFTATPDLQSAMKAFEDRHLGPTLIVDSDGKAYQLLDSLSDQPAAGGNTNKHCIQIEIVGMDERALLANQVQKQKVIEVVRELCEKFQIKKDNYDIASFSGIFSHGQQKKRFGGSAWMWGSEFDPGESYMKEIIESVGGRYYSDAEWKDRSDVKQWKILPYDWLP